MSLISSAIFGEKVTTRINHVYNGTRDMEESLKNLREICLKQAPTDDILLISRILDESKC